MSAPAPAILFSKLSVHPARKMNNENRPVHHDMGCLGIEALLAAGYEISAIFTHTDNPGEAFYGSVARLAAEVGIPVYAPDNVNHPLWVDALPLSPEVNSSFYYRHLICDEILQLVRRCI